MKIVRRSSYDTSYCRSTTGGGGSGGGGGSSNGGAGMQNAATTLVAVLDHHNHEWDNTPSRQDSAWEAEVGVGSPRPTISIAHVDAGEWRDMAGRVWESLEMVPKLHVGCVMCKMNCCPDFIHKIAYT